jgi:outer membrane protein insertion porin family
MAIVAAATAGGALASPADYEGKRIVSVAFSPASQPMEADQLSRLLPFHPNDTLNLDDVRRAIDSLYNTGRYLEIAVDVTPAENGVAVTIITTPHFFVGQVSVEGADDPPSASQLVNTAKLGLGTGFSETEVTQASLRLKTLLQSNGFYEAEVKPEISYRSATEEADIHFVLALGPRAKFSRPEITGDAGSEAGEVSGRTNWQKWWGLLGWRQVTENRVQQGLERVRRSYLKGNHLLAKVQMERMEYNSSTKTVTPHLRIEAGPEVTVKAEGDKISSGHLKQLIPVYQEQSVDQDLLVEGQRKVEDFFQAAGYFDVKVEYRQDQLEGGEQAIVYTITRGPRYKLVKLDVQGNKYFTNETVRERLAVKPASLLQYRQGRFSLDLLERDKEAIKDLYTANGFRDVKVESKIATGYKGKELDLAVAITIEEGSQWFVSDLDVTGVDLRLVPVIQDLVQSAAGQPYSSFNVATDRDNILNYYFNNGYPEARFDYQATPGPRPNTMSLRYAVQEGRRNFVRDVIITGLKETNEKLVDSRLAVAPGDPLSQSQMVEGQRRLYDLGIFAKVNMAVQNPEGRERNKYVLYQFEEASRYSVSTALGAEIARIGGGDPNSLQSPAGAVGFSPRVSLGLSRNNFMGIGHTIGVLSRFSNIQKRVALNYLAPQFSGNEKNSLSFSALWDDSRNVRTFTSRRWEGTAQFSQRLSRATTAQYRLTYRRVTVDENTLNISASLIPLFSQPTRVGLAAVTLIQDRRDDPIDSHRGYYNTVDVGVAARALGSQTQYGRVVWRNSTYYQLGKDRVLARSISFGGLYNYGTSPIPLPERFFAGGASSHRAFPENQAGPRDPITGFPVGGNAFLVNSIEYRFPLIGQSLGGVLFHDAGNVYTDLNSISFRYRQRGLTDFDYMVHAVGFGFRYRTPIGPVRLDLAYSPNSPRFVGFEGTREDLLLGKGIPNVLQRISRFQFHFSLGQSF